VEWFTRRKPRRKIKPADDEWVDLDRVSVPVDDMNDPTSLFLTLSMKHGTVILTWDDRAGVWLLRVNDRDWSAASQREALTAALADLEEKT
jgi:hypothetical protein